jgi:hypothetical protein
MGSLCGRGRGQKRENKERRHGSGWVHCAPELDEGRAELPDRNSPPEKETARILQMLSGWKMTLRKGKQPARKHRHKELLLQSLGLDEVYALTNSGTSLTQSVREPKSERPPLLQH